MVVGVGSLNCEMYGGWLLQKAGEYHCCQNYTLYLHRDWKNKATTPQHTDYFSLYSYLLESQDLHDL